MSRKELSSNELIERSLDKRVNREYKKKTAIRVIVEIVIAALLVYVLFGVVLGIAVVRGDSMMPTFSKGSLCLFIRIDTAYSRGDAVIFTDSEGASAVKRVVAVGGDTVDIKDGKLFVNGEEENRITTAGVTEAYEDGVSFPLTVERDKVFVLGDNRDGAVDSRVFGCIGTDIITGRILAEIRLFKR